MRANFIEVVSDPPGRVLKFINMQKFEWDESSSRFSAFLHRIEQGSMEQARERY